MKSALLFLALLAGSLVAGTGAHAQHAAHEHGVARMNLSVEGKVVEIELETPLANVLSFEHAPETEAQKNEIRAMAALMHGADELFLFPKAARCRSAKVFLESEAIAGDFLLPPSSAKNAAATADAQANAAGGREENEESHADLDAQFTFHCDNPDALNGLDVLLFSKFPRLEELEAQMVTGKGQKAVELTPKASRIAW